MPVSVPTIAVPLLNVGLNTIGPELGLLRLTVNTWYGSVPSVAVTLSTEIVGAGSLSTIVPTPTALVFAVVPLVTVAVRLKVSFTSSMLSSVTDTRT